MNMSTAYEPQATSAAKPSNLRSAFFLAPAGFRLRISSGTDADRLSDSKKDAERDEGKTGNGRDVLGAIRGQRSEPVALHNPTHTKFFCSWSLLLLLQLLWLQNHRRLMLGRILYCCAHVALAVLMMSGCGGGQRPGRQQAQPKPEQPQPPPHLNNPQCNRRRFRARP